MRHFDVKMAVKLRAAIKAKRSKYSQDTFAKDINVGTRAVQSWEGKKAPKGMTMAARCNCLCLMDTEGIDIETLHEPALMEMDDEFIDMLASGQVKP